MITKYLTTDKTRVTNTASGLTVIVHADSSKPAASLCEDAASVGIKAIPVSGDPNGLLLYYNQIPLDEMQDAAERLLKKWYV